MGLLYGNSPAPTQTQGSGGLLGNLSDHVTAYNASPILDTAPNTSDNVPSIPYQKIPGTTTPASGFLNKLGTYARALETSPGTTLSRVLTGQGVQRVDNGAIISARMPLSQSQQIKANMGGNTVNGQQSQLDHVVPLELGGTNQQKNLKNITAAQDNTQGVMENYLGQALKGNLIDAKTAQTLMSQYKNGQIDVNGVYAGVKANPLQHQNLLQKAMGVGGQVVSAIANPIAKTLNEVGALGALIHNDQKGASSTLNPGGGLLHQGGVLQGQELNRPSGLNAGDYKKIVGTGAEIGSNVVGGGVAKDVAGNVIKRSLASSVLHGAIGGAVANPMYTAGSELANNQPLNIKDIGKSAVVGGVLGGGLAGTGSLLGSAIQRAQAAKAAGTPLPASALDAHVAQAEQLAKDAQKTATPAPQVGKNVAETAPQTSTTTPKPSVAQSNQAGFIDPAKAVTDVKTLIDKHNETTNYGQDLQHAASASEGNKQIILKDAASVLKNRDTLSNADKQTLQDFRDVKAAGLKPTPLPDHLKAEDAATTQLNKAAQLHDAELARLNGQEQKAQSILARDPSTYTHRVAQGKGGAYDYLLQGDRKSPLSTSRFGSSKPGDKSRVFQSITDEQGNRSVVAIKHGEVTALDHGATPLGTLKLKTNEDFLKKELSPYQTKIQNLQKEGDALNRVRVRGGASDARINKLAQKISLLEDPGNMSTLTKSESKSLRDTQLKLKELTNVKNPTTNATNRLQTINSKLIDLNNQVNKIHDKYDPNTLEQKVFTGNDGKKYTIGQATQSEVTNATGQKYYTDPKLNALTNYVESRTALENARFMESIKSDPRFSDFVSPPDKTAPKGWKSVQGFDQFRGYKFEPKTAETIKDILRTSSNEKDALDKVGKVLRQTIVYFPVKHDLNMVAAYVADRGIMKLGSPFATKRMASSLYQAMHEVINQEGPVFTKLQKSGFSLPSADSKQFETAFKKELSGLMNDGPALKSVAKQIGSTPKRLIDSYNKFQHVSVWELQDILNTARVIERMKPTMFSKGASFEDAMKQTERYNFQYKVPSRVAGSRSLSRTLQSDKVFFGRYRYDQWKILSNTLKDSVNLKHPSKAVEAWDKLAVLAIGSSLVMPLVNKGVQNLSGNKNAYVTAPGPLDLPEKAYKVYKGEKSLASTASGQLYLGPLQTSLDIKNNHDSFTGKQIYDPNASPTQQAKQTFDYLKSQIAPVQKAKSLGNTSGTNPLNVMLGLAGVSFPKNSPLSNKMNSLKFDSLPTTQAQAKAQAKSGDFAGANQTIKNYDAKILSAAKADLQANGQSVPDDQTLIKQLKKSGYYYAPQTKTIQSWSQPKKPVKGGFTP